MASSPANENDAAAGRFEAAALPFMGALYNKALHLTRRPEDAGDMVQETYLRAYRTFSSFKEGTNCKAWLFTILYSIFVNKYRREQREPDTVSIDELEETFHRTLADVDWETNFAALTGSELDWQGPEVNHALAKLPEDFRSAVLLVDVEGFTYEEAAAALECPVGTLRSRLFRARRMLFIELHDYARRMGFIRRPPI
jgi:RNA polymerase sigma-70 factor (ECF subfamily)